MDLCFDRQWLNRVVESCADIAGITCKREMYSNPQRWRVEYQHVDMVKPVVDELNQQRCFAYLTYHESWDVPTKLMM